MKNVHPADRLECVSHILLALEDKTRYELEIKSVECRHIIEEVVSYCEEEDEVPEYIPKTLRDISRILEETRDIEREDINNIRGLIDSGLAWGLKEKASHTEFPDSGMNCAEELGIRTIGE